MGRSLREDSNFLAEDESCGVTKALEDSLTDVIAEVPMPLDMAFLGERAASASTIIRERKPRRSAIRTRV
jgi:hypothetical protein